MSEIQHRKAKNYHRALAGLIMLIILLVPGIALFSKTIADDPQSYWTSPFPQTLTGEVRRGDGEWEPYTGQSLNALEGPVQLRGTLSAINTVNPLYLYLDHIDITLSIAGQEIFSTAGLHEDGVDACYQRWESVYLPEGTTADDLVEITLSNPHTVGNPKAYDQCLHNLFFMSLMSYDHYILQNGYISTLFTYPEMLEFLDTPLLQFSGPFWSMAAWVTIIFGVLLLGFALVDYIQAAHFGHQLWILSLLLIVVSGLMWTDRPNLDSSAGSLVVLNFLAHICRMLIPLLLQFNVAAKSGKRLRPIAWGLLIANVAFCFVMLLGAYLDAWTLCEADTAWLLAQMILLGLTLGMSCVELRKHHGFYDITMLLLCIAAIVEGGNAYHGWSVRGTFFCYFFLLEMLVTLIWVALTLPTYFIEAEKSRAMQLELAQMQYSVMLSQIQPHFLYNVLTAIRYLCKDRPEEAQKALEQFALYLRGNLSSLNQSAPIPFEKEIANVESYVALEKLRFDDALQVVWDLEVKDFDIPALSVQMLVENAIKHGIVKKKEGGTVTISTRAMGNRIEIVVADDGVGFDPQKTDPGDGRQHVGIKNVQYRLGTLCNGTLIIESVVGLGTRATIRIMKENAV